MTQKITIHCRYCLSEEVNRDAYVTWDTEKQEWELSNVYDHAYCNDCEGETKLVERDAETGEPVSEYDLFDDEVEK